MSSHAERGIRVAALALAMLHAQLRAQDLVEEFLAARNDPKHLGEVLRRRGMPMAELFDTVVPIRTRLSEHARRALRAHLRERRTEVHDLWRQEPARRRAREEVFAWCEVPWVEWHARGTPEEKGEIESVARFVDPETLFARLRAKTKSLRLSATVLSRIAVRAAREQPHPITHALLRLDRDDPGTWSAIGYGERPGRAFAALPLLTHKDPRMRARGAVVVRSQLKVRGPEWLLSIAAADPNAGVRLAAMRLPLRAGGRVDRDAAALLAAIDRDTTPGFMPNHSFSPQVRADLFQALVAAGRRDLAKPRARLLHGVGVSVWFQIAAGLGAGEATELIALAATTNDPVVALHLLLAAQAPGMAPDAKCAGVLAALLDHADQGVAAAAAQLIDRLLRHHSLPDLETRICERAMAAVGRIGSFQAHWPTSGGCTWPANGVARPAGRDASVLLTAARHCQMPLLERLLDELLQPTPQPEHPPGIPWPAGPVTLVDGRMHRCFVLDCLELLAPRATADQARRIHALLAPGYSKPTNGQDPVSQASSAVLHALYAAVPDDLLRWYEPLLADDETRGRIAAALARDVDAVPTERLRAFLTVTSHPRHSHPLLLAHCPDLLLADWLAGGDRRQRAIAHCGVLVGLDAPRLLALVESGTLPREMVAAACGSPFRPCDLIFLAGVLPRSAEAGELWQEQFVRAIGGAPSAARDVDLASLARLATCAVSEVALAAARRAAGLGNEGKEITREVLTRLLDDTNDDVVINALLVAAGTGVDTPNRPSAVARLRRAAHRLAATAADTADLRFASLDPTRCSWLSIQYAQSDVSVDTMRARLDGDAPTKLRSLLGSCTAVTAANALLLVGALDVWDAELEHDVLERTLDDDPNVRRAAYEALATRDPDVWPCALLVHEAALDPDPRVQAVAQGKPENGRGR